MMRTVRSGYGWRYGVLLAVMVFLPAGLAAAQTTLTGPRLASESTDAGAASGNAPAAAPEPEAVKSNFLHLLTRGGWAIWPLGACSLLGLALIIERGLALRKSQIFPDGFVAGLEKVYRGRRDTDLALDYCRKRPSAISRVLAAGVRKLPEGNGAAEMAMNDQGATEVARLRKNLRLLHGISAITPTLGLLGTVWGMIRAFEAASTMGLGSHSTDLTKGIYEALVATLCGLMIAVPVLLCYYIFLGIIDKNVLELNDTSQAFLEKHGTVAGSEALTADAGLER